MKDKKRRYDLSYFMKYGGSPPSINVSEMSNNARDERNQSLNEELQEIEALRRENLEENLAEAAAVTAAAAAA